MTKRFLENQVFFASGPKCFKGLWNVFGCFSFSPCDQACLLFEIRFHYLRLTTDQLSNLEKNILNLNSLSNLTFEHILPKPWFHCVVASPNISPFVNSHKFQSISTKSLGWARKGTYLTGTGEEHFELA